MGAISRILPTCLSADSTLIMGFPSLCPGAQRKGWHVLGGCLGTPRPWGSLLLLGQLLGFSRPKGGVLRQDLWDFAAVHYLLPPRASATSGHPSLCRAPPSPSHSLITAPPTWSMVAIYTGLPSAHRNLVSTAPHSLTLLSPLYPSGCLLGRISQALWGEQQWGLARTLLYSQHLAHCQEHSGHSADICVAFLGSSICGVHLLKCFSPCPKPNRCHHPPCSKESPMSHPPSARGQ